MQNDARVDGLLGGLPAGHRGGGAAAHKPPFADPKAVQDYGERLLHQVISSLYHRLEYLAASQLSPIKEFIKAEFRHQDPGNYAEIFYRLQIRVMLASDWLARDPNRYIPIPSRYFDRDNPNGFMGTARWYKDMQANTEKARDYKQRFSAMMKAWGSFMHTIGGAVRAGGFTGYMQGRRELEGKMGNLAHAYDYVMLSLVQGD